MPIVPARPPSPLAWLLLVLLGLTWGGSFLGVAKALRGFGPLTIAAGRIAIAAVILVAVALATGTGLPPRGDGAGPARSGSHASAWGSSRTRCPSRSSPGARSR